eukprot:12726736-Alexandrium_andersonii.AAC.1
MSPPQSHAVADSDSAQAHPWGLDDDGQWPLRAEHVAAVLDSFADREEGTRKLEAAPGIPEHVMNRLKSGRKWNTQDAAMA